MLMAVVVWNGSSVRVDNLLQRVPELELLTWGLQVMPVFFAAGAIANRMSLASSTAPASPGVNGCGTVSDGSSVRSCSTSRS